MKNATLSVQYMSQEGKRRPATLFWFVFNLLEPHQSLIQVHFPVTDCAGRKETNNY